MLLLLGFVAVFLSPPSSSSSLLHQVTSLGFDCSLSLDALAVVVRGDRRCGWERNVFVNRFVEFPCFFFWFCVLFCLVFLGVFCGGCLPFFFCELWLRTRASGGGRSDKCVCADGLFFSPSFVNGWGRDGSCVGNGFLRGASM